MTASHWQVQEARQHVSELIRSAEAEGPQVVTRRGEDVAMVMDSAEYRPLRGGEGDVKQFPVAGPDFDVLGIVRPDAPAPVIDLERGHMNSLTPPGRLIGGRRT